MTLTSFQEELCSMSRWDFTDLKALYVNCTLKPSPELSHTEGLMRISTAIMERNGVEVDFVRAVDHDLAPGVWPDMREHGAATDEWPELYERVHAADIHRHRRLDVVPRVAVLTGEPRDETGRQLYLGDRRGRRAQIGGGENTGKLGHLDFRHRYALSGLRK